MNTRYIDIEIDENIVRVGYNYLNSKFYVTNKDTTTYRVLAEEIQEVLHSLGITTITLEELQYLKDNIETLSKIYYTWEKTGSYIHSIQFNDFADYQLVLDCNISKLYIQNSTTIVDLLANESVKEVRIPILCTYCKDTLGLEVTKEVMLAIYRLLESYYKPTCYNQIAEQEKEKILKELSSVKKSISNIRKTSNDLIFDDTLLDELIFKQRELTQRLALIECGEISYAVDENEIDELLNRILNIEKLDDELVSKLIKRIEIGEVVVTELGPQRDITITYSFEEM